MRGLSVKDTNVLKGVALLMLLFHHLWYENTDLDRNGVVEGAEHILQMLSISCKQCVAIFVFLSGYGLCKSYKGNVRTYFIHRFIKLYFNYWFIWILFVPIGMLLFNRLFPEVYHTDILLKTIVDVLGLSESFDFESYNPTWWFYSCIILLYLIYPLFHQTLRYWYVWLIVGLSFSYILGLLSKRYIELEALWTFFNPIRFYLLPFICGALLARYKIIEWVNSCKKVRINVLIWGVFDNGFLTYFNRMAWYAV